MGDIVHAGAAMLRGVAAQFVGKLQLACDRIEARYGQRAFIRGHGITREPALFEHHNTADHDGGHAVGGRDDQGAAGRGGCIGLSSLRTIRQAGFVHRHRIRTGSRIGRFDDDAVILAVDGDGHLAFGDITVRVRICVGELFRQRFAVRQFLHRRVVVVQPVAVGTVGIQGDRTKMPVLVRIPGKFRTVRAGYRTRERVTDGGDGIPFRHLMREALDSRYVVHDVHRDGPALRRVVRIRHHHTDLMADAVGIVVSGAVLQRIVAQRVGVAQLAIGIAGAEGAFTMHVQSHFRAVQGHYHALGTKRERDALHTVGSRDIQRTRCRGGRTFLSSLGAIRKTGFVHRHRIRSGSRIGRFDDDTVILAVDGDGHLTFGDIAVRVRIGVGELFRQRLAIGEVLHSCVVIIERIAVAAVRIQSNGAVLALLCGVRPDKIRAVRTGRRASQGIPVDDRGIPFRHIMREAPDHRHVVHHVHRDGTVDLGAVHIRHRHGQVMGDIVHAGAAMLRGVAAQFVGKLQLACDRIEARYGQRAFIRGHGITREPALFEHHNTADHDGGHAVGGRDDQGAAGRGGCIGLSSLRTIRQAGFVHRHRIRTGSRIGRFDDDAVILAVDGDGHLAFGDITVRVRICVGELFRQRFAVRQFLHRRVVVVQPVAVGTVGIQGDRTKMPVLVRIPGKFRTVRAGYRTRERVTDGGDGIPFRHLMREALDSRYVVHHVHRDGRTVAVAVRIRHRHGQIMRDLRVRSRIAFVVFRGVPVERIAEIQLARDRVIARHGQGAFICGHNVAGQLAVFENHHVTDDDGGHAVGGVDVQGAAGRSGRSGLTHLRTARQAAFIHRQIDRTRFRAGSNGHIVVDIDFWSAGLHGIRSKLRAAVETDIQTPQMIDAVQQIAAAVLVITAAARGTAGGRARGGHQVFAKGREEILPADLHTFHLEGRHLFLGIGGVEALQLDGRAILKSQDKIVAIAGQRRGIRGKVEDEASVRSAGDGLCGTSGRLGKTDIGHEGPPKKK